MPGADGRHRQRPARQGSAAAARTSRVERRRAARVRRNRVGLAVATVSAVGILAAWFPASELLHQRSQLSAASAELHKLDRQNAALHERATQLRTPATLGRIAQQQYDLVPPGEQAYQVLPPSGSGSADGTLGTTSARGHGSPDTSSSSDGAAPSSGSTGTSGSFLDRVVHTLEFWR